MHLKSLFLTNFKNYQQIELSFSPRINCFVGPNGVGKTNLLDAIYYLSMCKSYINPINNQNIRYDETFSILQGEFILLDKVETIYCSIDKSRKKVIKRNRKNYRKLAEHIGLLPVVMISPVDGNLISGGSEERRRYIDRVVSQFDKDYLEKLIRYNRALNQRNQLLKDFAKKGYFDTETLDIWDEQLISLGSAIYEKRKQFSRELVPVFQNYYTIISDEKEDVGLTYSSQLESQGFRKLLTDSMEKDRIMQYTTVGIHKDDLMLTLEGHPIKRAGSQGQQKTFLVALKFAQFEFIKEKKELSPILLLDDIFDKFDRQRVRQIIQLVSDQHFGQIFITDTSEDRLHNLLQTKDIDYRLIKVQENGVRQDE